MDNEILARPYPLRRNYNLFVIPIFFLTISGLLIAVSNALSVSVERAYSAQTASLHAALFAPILGNARHSEIGSGGKVSDADQTRQAIETEAKELDLLCAVAFTEDGKILAATNDTSCMASTISRIPEISDGQTVFLEEDGPPVHWTVLSRAPGMTGPMSIYIATSEKASAREKLLDNDTIIWIVILGVPLIGSLCLSTYFVSRAQNEIDTRTNALNEARKSLAHFVSDSTEKRVSSGRSSAERLAASILVLDIRDFSSFVEQASAEEAAALVSEVASHSFAAILEHGGDIDRLVGDGLVAWFEGSERKTNALRASEAILTSVSRANLPRGIGIGLHDGTVIEAVIGTEIRKDATILGSPVNVTARLCAAALPGEIVASSEFFEVAAGHEFNVSARGSLLLKGIANPIETIRLSLMNRRVPV